MFHVLCLSYSPQVKMTWSCMNGPLFAAPNFCVQAHQPLTAPACSFSSASVATFHWELLRLINHWREDISATYSVGQSEIKNQ